MPWCPICKNEYKKGYAVCADCGAELVESLEEVPVVQPDEEESAIDDFRQSNDTEEAYSAYNEFDQLMEDEYENIDLMESAADDYLEQMPGKVERTPLVYQNKKERAAEYKSSAWALLVVGIAGIAFIIVNELGILPFQLNFNKFMVYGVMGTLFVLFILFAVYSLIQSGKILAEAEAEDALSEQMRQYLLQHFAKEKPFAGSPAEKASELQEEYREDGGEESLYFSITSEMKEALEQEFEDAPKALIEHLVDEYYEQSFA